MICRQIVACVDDAAAGPSYTVPALSKALSTCGLDSAVMAVGTRAGEAGLQIFDQDLAHLPVAGRLVLSHRLDRAIHAVASRGAVLHSHGLWLMPNIYPARAVRRAGCPWIVSPRGMLGPEALAFSRIRKRAVWALGQGAALREARCFHATSEAEVEDIRRAGLRAPVAIVPNGIDVPEPDPKPGGRTVLYLGRLHPKKGIGTLVAAWSRLAHRHPDWCLKIIGPSEIGQREMLEVLIRDLAAPRVTISGPSFGAEKWDAFRGAGLVVLPTLNENFGMVVAEALAAGTPVICTKGAPWHGLATEGCGLWIDHGPDAMAAALDMALALPDATRALMGVRGRAWMQRDFGWNGIAARMAEVYRWCLGQGPQPGCVVT